MTANAFAFPGAQWERIAPADAGMDPAKLDEAKQRLVRDAEGSGDSRYRVVIVRGGRLVAEWNSGVRSEDQLRMASATKSIFSSVLGIAIEDGRIESADSKLIDYYPEAMDVPESCRGARRFQSGAHGTP